MLSTDNYTLNLIEAQKALRSGKIINHRTFTANELLRMENGNLYDEAGIELDYEDFFKVRNTPLFVEGWAILEEKGI